MIRSKSRFLFRGAAFALGLVFGSLAGCTPVDDTLGQEYIPDANKMVTRMTEITDMADTYVAQGDSLQMSLVYSSDGYSYSFYNFLGKSAGAHTGVGYNCSSLLQFTPYLESYYSDTFGFNPTPDSLILYLYPASFSYLPNTADYSNEQVYNFYTLHDAPDPTTAYMSDFDPSPYYNTSDLLFKGTLSGRTIMKLKIPIDTEPGKSYAEGLLNDISIYEHDTVFLKTYKGLYATHDGVSPSGASYKFELNSQYSGLVLYYHNYDEENPAERLDTATVQYYLGPSYYDSAPISTSISVVKHTYDAQITAALNDTLPGDPTLTKTVVDALGGAYTYLRFKDKVLNTVTEKLFDNGIQYSTMVIDKATLEIALDVTGDPVAYNEAIQRLGLMQTYKWNFYYLNTSNQYNFYAGIPDYNYYYETQGSTLPYGGYIDRSRGVYTMDVTTYVQRLVTDPSKQKEMYLVPDLVYNLNYSFGAVYLKGTGSDNPVKLKLTYTLIK